MEYGIKPPRGAVKLIDCPAPTTTSAEENQS